MLIPAILVSIVALLAAMDEQLFGASMMARPLFTGPIIGLIMGDLQTGVIIGATLESMFMGSIMVGSAVPPEVYASSILSIAIAIQTGAGSPKSQEPLGDFCSKILLRHFLRSKIVALLHFFQLCSKLGLFVGVQVGVSLQCRLYIFVAQALRN